MVMELVWEVLHILHSLQIGLLQSITCFVPYKYYLSGYSFLRVVDLEKFLGSKLKMFFYGKIHHFAERRHEVIKTQESHLIIQ